MSAWMEDERVSFVVSFVASDPRLAPARATAGAAGFDLRAAEGHVIRPGERLKIGTGVRLALPPGFEATVRPRSSLSLRGIDAPIGTIDCDYRGEIAVILVNNSREDYYVDPFDRIAQLVIAHLAPVALMEATALGETARGDGGFGSTGRD